MRAVAEVAEPGLESWRIVLLDGRTVSQNGGFARNRGPLAG